MSSLSDLLLNQHVLADIFLLNIAAETLCETDKLAPVTRYFKDTVNCFNAAFLCSKIAIRFFKASKEIDTLAVASIFIPLATRVLVYLSKELQIFEKEIKFLDQNLGKILHVPTLIVSATILGLAKGRTNERIMAGCAIALDATLMYARYKQNDNKFFT